MKAKKIKRDHLDAEYQKVADRLNTQILKKECLRTTHFGLDRKRNRYWVFWHTPSAVYVQSGELKPLHLPFFLAKGKVAVLSPAPYARALQARRPWLTADG